MTDQFERDANLKIVMGLMERFDFDLARVTRWLWVENPHFGCSPVALIIFGKSHKVLAFIEATKEGQGV